MKKNLDGNPEIRVRLTEDYKGLPAGSSICVEKELKYYYKGIWSSMYGSYPVKVPKKICEIKK